MLYWILKVLLYIPLRILFPTKVIGKRNIPKKGGFIEICNHRRMMDIVMVHVIQKRKPRILGKKELFKFFLFRWFLKALGGVPVDRQDVRPSSLKNLVKVLKRQKIVLIFPEGTRSRRPDGKMLELKQGTAVLAIMSKVPITPMYFAYPPRLFRRNYILIGKAIDLSQYFNKIPTPEILEQANDLLTERMLQLQDEAELYKKKKKKK